MVMAEPDTNTKEAKVDMDADSTNTVMSPKNKSGAADCVSIIGTILSKFPSGTVLKNKGPKVPVPYALTPITKAKIVDMIRTLRMALAVLYGVEFMNHLSRPSSKLVNIISPNRMRDSVLLKKPWRFRFVRRRYAFVIPPTCGLLTHRQP